MKKITLKCSFGKCPRKKKIDWDDIFPKGTAIVILKCPWHYDGDFDSEQYYDKKGKELFWQPI